MTDENGNLSIDFLAGFTIFMVAFIWVVTMIPGLMIGLQSYTIDYDAVAYRTGVILVEDPGWPVSPPWESFTDMQKSNVTRFGLALSKDTPNILSQDKVNRFFCETAFIFPDDYRTRAIFGDYPYGFNISLIDFGGQVRSRGDPLPDGHGTIRRLVKIKGTSNATIGDAKYTAYSSSYIKTGNASTHVFSILIDNPRLLTEVTDPIYQIDPSREQLTINITDLRSTITDFPTAVPPIDHTTSAIVLQNIKVYKRDGNSYSNIPLPASEYPYLDGSSTRIPAMPINVTDNVTLQFSPRFFDLMKAQNSQIYIALGFEVTPASTFLNNTQALPNYNNLDGALTFNNTNTLPFNYNYDPINVTQPSLRDAVVEVAVWSGSSTGPIGGGGLPVPNGSFTIQANAGAGGTLSPTGSVIVNNGANQTFAITPNTGYHITDVVVDTVSQGVISTYTFTNVVQDHKISASFAINTYNITASAGAGGTISPTGAVSVNYGANQPFTITPNIGSNITDVIIDGVSNGAISSYTFNNVMANHTIAATFAINTYVITPTTPLVNGAITPNTPQTVNYGDTPTFTFTPSPGYHLDTVFVDGNPLPPTTPTTYTFPAVASSQTISATFAANVPVSIFYDGFEPVRPSTNSWVELGTVDWGAYTPRNGNNDVRLRQNEAITRTISTASYSQIVVQFAWAGQNLEAGEYVRAEYSTDGGTSWTTLSQINGVIGAGVPAFTNFVSPTLPASADHNANFQLRFRIQSSFTDDYAYIDDVRVTGVPD